jgi:hypothetical protein
MDPRRAPPRLLPRIAARAAGNVACCGGERWGEQQETGQTCNSGLRVFKCVRVTVHG